MALSRLLLTFLLAALCAAGHPLHRDEGNLGRAGSGASQSLPEQLGAVAWWDGSQGKTVNGSDEVTAWEDQINGYVLTPDEGVDNPGNVSGGVAFATQDRLANASLGATFKFLHDGTGGSIYIRLTPDLTTNANMVGAGLVSSSGPGTYLFRVSTGTMVWRVLNNAGTAIAQLNTSSAFTTGVEVNVAVSVGTTITSWLNGTINSGGSVTSPSSSDAAGFAVGSTFATTLQDGQETVAQVIIFDKVLTTDEVQQLDAWSP